MESKKQEIQQASIDIGLTAIDAIPYVGGVITRTIDRKLNRVEIARIEKLTQGIFQRVEDLEAKLSQVIQNNHFNEFIFDLSSQVRLANGDNLIKAYSGIAAHAIKTQHIQDCIFAQKVLSGFTEHHLHVLSFMHINRYDNAEAIKVTDETGEKSLCSAYMETPIYSFTENEPKLSTSDGNYEGNVQVIDATIIPYPKPILVKIANDLKTMGLASCPSHHQFLDDPNSNLYLTLTDIGKWFLEISDYDSYQTVQS